MAVQGFDGCDWWEEEGTTSTEEKIILLSKNISSLIVEVCSVHRANHLGHRHIIHDLTKINKEVISLIPEKDRWYYEI